MGQKMVCFGSLRLTISRQDETIEVHEVGSERPSSGGNGGHVLSLYPLTWRSLGGCRGSTDGTGSVAGSGSGLWGGAARRGFGPGVTVQCVLLRVYQIKRLCVCCARAGRPSPPHTSEGGGGQGC
jgi:hypothetical protein